MRAIYLFWGAVGLGIALLTGCGGGGGGSSVSPTPGGSPTPIPTALSGATATVALQGVGDAWSLAAPRWRDIGNNLYSSAFRASFAYSAVRVSVMYETAPRDGVFAAHVAARGLKPNFAYQLKLAGKPTSGNRGWGRAQSFVEATSPFPGALAQSRDVAGTPVGGDDWTNQQLGYAGRWWDDTRAPALNLNDAYFRANSPAHTVYGYLFLGDFVTDANGNASADLRGDRSLHITWQDEQSGAKDVLGGNFTLAASSSTPAYDAPLSATAQRLWYELEAGRAQPVHLPRGTYHCRLLVTEEAFHGAGGEGGGQWITVLASEDVGDTSAGNDVVWAVG